MTEQPTANNAEPEVVRDVAHEEEPEPRGTLAVLLVYMALLIAFWGWTFILLLQRG